MKRFESNRTSSKPNDKEVKLNSWTDKVSDWTPVRKNGLFLGYSENATIHGIRRTTDIQHSKIRRGFWSLVVVGTFAGLLYTVFSQVVRMLSYPTITQQSLQFRNKLSFPAVTLCNLNPIKRSILGRDIKIRKSMLATSVLSSYVHTNWSDPIWNFTFSAEETAEVDSNVQYYGHSLNETLTSCKWNNKMYKCTELFVTQKTDFGMCYTFNGMTKVNFTRRESLHTGSIYGLTIVANINQSEYLLAANTDAAGLRVLLHDPSETPLVEGKGFDVSPGMATKASIKLTQVINLPPPFVSYDQKECTDITNRFQNPLHYFDRYDYQACIYECRLNYVVNICGCRIMFDRGNATYCHPKVVVECYFPQFEKFTEEGKYKECLCPTPCVKNYFDAEVSMSAYPSSVLMEEANEWLNFNFTEPQFRRNNLKLTLAYDIMVVTEIRQVAEFSYENSMSTLGGQLGIFIGASIVSVLELLELGWDILVSAIQRIGRKTQPQKS